MSKTELMLSACVYYQDPENDHVTYATTDKHMTDSNRESNVRLGHNKQLWVFPRE